MCEDLALESHKRRLAFNAQCFLNHGFLLFSTVKSTINDAVLSVGLGGLASGKEIENLTYC